jgi:hypothetical protein
MHVLGSEEKDGSCQDQIRRQKRESTCLQKKQLRCTYHVGKERHHPPTIEEDLEKALLAKVKSTKVLKEGHNDLNMDWLFG